MTSSVKVVQASETITADNIAPEWRAFFCDARRLAAIARERQAKREGAK
jgi:hypothetical protein